VAGGVLTKWTAPAFFYATVLPLLWWRGRLRLLVGWPHLISAGLAAAICLAWAGWAAKLAGWDVLCDTVARESMQRLSPGYHQLVMEHMAPHHQAPLYPWAEALLHPFKLLTINLPWSLFALLTLRPGFAQLWDERGRRLLQALHCWSWPNMLFWSIIPEHAPRHSFPLFPGIAGLAAMVWVAWMQGRGPKQLRIGQVLAVLVVLWLIVKVVFVEVVTPQRNHAREPQAKGEQIAAIVPRGQPLYVFHLKDEGIMFYYTRVHSDKTAGPPVRRLAGPKRLVSPGEPMYCILEESEWQQWQRTRLTGVRELLRLFDEQHSPIVLVEWTG